MIAKWETEESIEKFSSRYKKNSFTKESIINKLIEIAEEKYSTVKKFPSKIVGQ